MEDAASLEAYLREAEIDLYGHFEAKAGGGHPDKQLVVVRGGIGGLAKLARTEQEVRQCRSEVGAYTVAQALGWGDLVPVTVWREVPTAAGIIEASVQVVWPAFATAQELGLTESSVEERDALRAAVLDSLLMNSDRNSGNWGLIVKAKLALIDHGHTALSDQPGVSGFAAARKGEDLPDDHGERLEALVLRGPAALAPHIDDERAVSILERAEKMLEDAAVGVDG